jgi:hypothetical protein
MTNMSKPAMAGARQRPRTRSTTLSVVALTVLILLGGLHAAASAASVSSRGVVAWDSFRRLDLLPYMRHGVRTFQASSADPTDNNDDGYTGRYSCLHPVDQGCLLAEHNGPGELESVWSAGDQVNDLAAAGRLLIELDGHAVVDKSLAALVSGDAGEPFVFPLALNAGESSGGFSINVPMPFRHRMRVISQRNPHYFHVVYRKFVSAEGIVASTARNRAPTDVRTELLRAGTRDPKPPVGASAKVSRAFRLAAGRQLVLARLKGSGTITQLSLRFARYGLSRARTA